MQGDTDSSSASATPEGSAELSSSLRLLLHIKDNQISYMIGILVAYQLGILDKLWTYGAGVCV
jgi:hypothetical protein